MTTSLERAGLQNFAEQLVRDLHERVQRRCDHHFVRVAKNTTMHLGPVRCERCGLVRHDTLPSPP